MQSPNVTLRPMLAEEVSEMGRVSSEFEDFGPTAPLTSPKPCSFNDTGGLVVEVEGAVAGTVSWTWRQWGPNAGSRCLMIGIGLREEFRGRGVGVEAQAALVDLIFQHTTVNRIEAHTDVTNLAEQRCLEKVGFQAEGITRGAQWRGAGYHDGILYGLLRSDWTGGQGAAAGTNRQHLS